MTLIRTVISNFGIIQAADSNLTQDHRPAGAGRKVFELGFDHAALALAGDFTVKGVRMDEWMPTFISSYTGTEAPTLEGFARRLRDELEEEVGSSGMGLYHVAGYVEVGDGAHPEMWFVSNVTGIAPSGEYEGVGDWHVSEDFWHRDYPKVRTVFAQDGYQWYINGTAHGRIAHNMASEWLRHLFAQIWSNPEWDFYEPRSLEGLAAIVDAEMRVVSALYRNGQYRAPYVGGETQIITLPPPPNAVAL
jgi:hypothetical protein